MLETMKNAWKLPDLRKKIIYTLMIIAVFRIGSAIPVPFLNPDVLSAGLFGDGSLLGYFNMLTGGALRQAGLFALSISPYITSSIVIQLLAVAIPALERMAKEGEEGRKKLTKITRYVTVALAVLQGFAYYTMLKNGGAVLYTDGFSGVLAGIVIVSCFTAGACFVVWLGEQIDAKGIGNGISMLLFAGIVAGGKDLITTFFVSRTVSTAFGYQTVKGYIPAAIDAVKAGGFSGDAWYLVTTPIILVLFVLVIAFIVLMTEAERRIPIQYAKRVVGRKMYGGQSSYIPIKVNMSGVLPVIFASSLLAIPGTIAAFFPPENTEGLWYKFTQLFNYDSWLYAIIYFLLIIAFSYFYVAIQYNPVEMANNLRKNNGGIPGIRPGKPTSDFISKIINKITIVGAIFLAIVAVLPIIVGGLSNMDISLGGTTIIIVVGVALDTVRQMESQMMMRHYKGFLE